MPFDLDRAHAWLSGRSMEGPTILGAPPRDLRRSPAARQVGDLAAAEGLSLFHFEHRVALELPEEWIAPGAEGALEPPDWRDGVLPEPKYQSFRHDLYLGSLHPGHRGKWTTHELCHGLVGTAWRADASPLFHATAARLAELLPVVLYYFLDEFGLRRCADHAGDGALFRTYCGACEEAVEEGWDPSQMQRRWLQGAKDALDRELAALARSRRLGRPVPYRWATLDLASDGVAYARSHGLRLDSAAFHRWAERFGVGFRSLEALEARVIEVTRAICEGEALSPGPGRWVAQDLGWRLLQVAAQSAGEAKRALEGLVDSLAEGAQIGDVVRQYRALEAEWVLPEAERVFAVGYDLPETTLGRSVDQVRRGLRTVIPLTLELSEDAGIELVEPFLREDLPAREPLGARFVRWLEGRVQAEVAELAAYEVALRTAQADGLAAALGAPELGEALFLARGAVALVCSRDVAVLAERVDAGEVRGVAQGARLGLEGRLPDRDGVGLLVGRDGAGDAVVVEVPAEVARGLAAGEALALGGLDPEERAALWEMGLISPRSWSLVRR